MLFSQTVPATGINRHQLRLRKQENSVQKYGTFLASKSGPALKGLAGETQELGWGRGVDII